MLEKASRILWLVYVPTSLTKSALCVTISTLVFLHRSEFK